MYIPVTNEAVYSKRAVAGSSNSAEQFGGGGAGQGGAPMDGYPAHYAPYPPQPAQPQGTRHARARTHTHARTPAHAHTRTHTHAQTMLSIQLYYMNHNYLNHIYIQCFVHLSIFYLLLKCSIF